MEKIEGSKKQSKVLFTQMGQLKDINGNHLPNIPNMVANCVGWHRRKMLPIKTIYLCPAYYHQFTDWFRRLCVEREADLKANLLTLDGVEIEMMGQHHIVRNKTGNESFDWDYYEDKK